MLWLKGPPHLTLYPLTAPDSRIVFHISSSCDILCLQETWLLNGNMNKLSEINSDYVFTGISGVDSSADVLQGRPYGGTGILWKKTLAGSISVIKSGHNRLSAIKLVFLLILLYFLLMYICHVTTNGFM